MNAPVQASDVALAPVKGNSWHFVLGILAVSVVALALIFSQEALGAFRVWMASTTYNHCFLIVPISAYMIWERRDKLAGVAPAPDFRAILLIPLLSLLWFGASIFGVLEAQQFVVMTILQAMLLGVLGWPVYRRVMAPFLYLYFLVPTGEFLVPMLQDFTARFAVLGLQLLGIPVYSDGILIEIPAGAFQVAEACAGLRFLTAALAFGVFYATEIYQSRTRRLIFIGLSIVVPIIANGFRALGLIAAAQYLGNATAVEADHITYGWVFFSLVLVALIFIGRRFSDRERGLAEDTARQPSLGQPANHPTFAFAAAFAVGLAASGPLLAAVLDRGFTPVTVQAAAPQIAPPWNAIPNLAPEWRPQLAGPDPEFRQTFADGANRIEQSVALYASQGRTSNLIRSQNRIADFEAWTLSNQRSALAHIGGRAVQVNSVEIASGLRRKLVWWFYMVGGAPAATLLDVKRRQVQAYVTGDRCPSAFIGAAIDETPGGPEAARILDRFFASMEDPAVYLCRSQRSPGA